MAPSSLTPSRTVAGRIVTVTGGAIAVVAVAIGLFVVYPASAVELLGVIAAIAAIAVGVRFVLGVARSLFPAYTVAEVRVEGPITRDGGGALPARPQTATADEIAEQIERADEDRHVDALIVRLNTPGGEITPSDDIKRAVESFDGPAIGFATDLCASGGYWIASGCDEIWARDVSLVGSIGVIGSRVVATDLAEKVGLSYEGFTAGEYKDAGMPLKEMTDREREYFQDLVDTWYEEFIDRVSAARDVDPSALRETEARVYPGTRAAELDLVDSIGTREDVEARIADRLGVDAVTVETFEPSRPLVQRMRRGTATAAYAFGAGIASVFHDRSPGIRV